MVNSRVAGVLMPIFSLPSRWGIGRMGSQAEHFIDQLASAKQSIWQILPLGPTGYGDSPYSSFSTHAGNPYFIDLDELVSWGLLTEDELASYDWGTNPDRVDYGKVYQATNPVLKLAFKRAGDPESQPEFRAFTQRTRWLDDYTLFMAIKGRNQQRSWIDWPDDLRHRDSPAIELVRNQDSEEIAFQAWLQWIFSMQWNKLHVYARQAGVKILGDLPIYVSPDSVDAWANPELFELDDDLMPITVSGCPPDGFSAAGQLWNNPIYDWEEHKRTGYVWWAERLSSQLERVDILRIDHFRGLESYYEINAGASDARKGCWKTGPGMNFFNAMRRHLGNLPLVVEDLGYLTPEVEQLRKDTGFPGMKLIQFAFDSREGSDYLPHNYYHDCVCYTGTHDNDTVVGWFDSLSDVDKRRAKIYLNCELSNPEQIHWKMITCAMTSVADTCIIPIPDYLGLGSQGRINTPAVPDGNWQWRMRPDALDPELLARICELTKVTERD